METEHYQTIRNLNDRLSVATRDSFSELVQYLEPLDPIRLLSQLTLTFLSVPEGTFVAESDDTVQWARWIEFVAAFLLSKEYPKNPEQNIDGRHLEKIEGLLNSYFGNIGGYIGTSVSDNEKDKETHTIVSSAKLYSLHVRGEAYPHQLLELSKELYSEHDEWFRRRLGFTIDDTIKLSESITHEYDRRINEENERARSQAKEYVAELVEKHEASEEDKDDLETKAYCYLYFGHADSILSFSLDQLVTFSGFTEEICQKYLARLSQAFGYKNPNFQNVFQDPYAAPWDYNTLYERPIVRHKEKYLVPVPSLFPTVLFNTFYYDFMDDIHYRSTWERKYGAWLEKKTASYFAKLFPPEEIVLNPKYPDGRELADVLVLHDRKIFIVQCKTKKLRYESQIGRSFEFLREDLEKGVKESFEQALRAREYLSSCTQPEIGTDYGRLIIDGKQVSDVFLISVTLGSYQDMTTRLANINPSLGLFSHSQYPWAVSLFDLMVIAELIDYPAMFVHYAKRRMEVERTNFQLMADEIDLLGFYFKQGLVLETDDFEMANFVALTGFSLDIDRYMFDKYECGVNPAKPKQIMPAGFEDYLAAVERLESEYKTDCAMRLLGLGYQGRQRFVNAVEETKEKTKSDSQLHSFSTILDDGHLGFSFIAMDAGGSVERLFRQSFSFAVAKKHQTKCEEWVGLGWDRNSERKIDVAVFLSYEWFDDPILDEIAGQTLKEGTILQFRDPRKDH